MKVLPEVTFVYEFDRSLDVRQQAESAYKSLDQLIPWYRNSWGEGLQRNINSAGRNSISTSLWLGSYGTLKAWTLNDYLLKVEWDQTKPGEVTITSNQFTIEKIHEVLYGNNPKKVA